MKRNIRIAFALCLVWLVAQTVAVAQTIPPTLHARIIQLEDERNLNGDELTKLLKHASPKVRERAALAIGRIGDKRMTPNLARLLSLEKDDNVKAMAIFALGELEDRKSYPFLAGVLNNNRESLQIQARVAEALGKVIGISENASELGADLTEATNQLIIKRLSEQPTNLTSDQKLLASLSITALMRIRSATSIEPLAQQLKSADADIRAQAANALARIRQPIASAVPALLEALNDSDHNVRANAARALGVSKDARAVEPLIKLLGDKNEQVQVSAIRALAAIGDKRAVEPLIEAGRKLCQKDKDHAWCHENSIRLLEIVSALGTVKDERAIPLLHDVRVVFGAGAYSELELATASFGEKEFFKTDEELLLYGVGDWQHFANVAQGLGEINSELSLETLWKLQFIAILEDQAMPQIMRAFAKLKPKFLADILRSALKHKDVTIRATAANLIANLIEDKNLNSLVAARVASTKDNDNDAKLAILTALSKYKSEKSVEAIKAALTDSDHLVRRRAVDLLKQMGAGDFSDRIGIVQTGNDKLFYQRVAARMNKKVTATLHTYKGAITMELFPAEAPITVDSFVKLARKGYFNDLTFHRVVPNFVIQGGDPRGTGEGGPGYQIRCEVNTRPYIRGAVGMALSGKDTGGSQFFITHSPQPHLDGGYTVFGQVTKGMEVVDQIARGDRIKRIEISER